MSLSTDGNRVAGDYLKTCAVTGLAVGWLPLLLHGPIPAKFDRLHLAGSTLVLGFHFARLSIGLLVGITWWPRSWWIRGPMVGVLAMLPLGFVLLATPGCGGPCMFWNVLTGSAVGLIVGGVARLRTGAHAAVTG